MRFVSHEPREVLVDEKEIEELGIARRHDHEPGRRYRGEQDEPADPVQPAPQTPIPLQQGVDQQHRAGQDDPDQSLGQHRERECDPRREHPGALLAGGRIVALGDEQASQADAHPEGDARIEGEDLRIQHVGCAAAEHRGAIQPAHRAAEAQPHVADEHNAQEPGHRGPEAGRPLVDAEDRIRRRGDPVLQGGLLEILDAVQPRRDPVAPRNHLARDFGVSALVRMDQAAVVEAAKPDDGENEQQNGDAAAVARGIGSTASGERAEDIAEARDFTGFPPGRVPCWRRAGALPLQRAFATMQAWRTSIPVSPAILAAAAPAVVASRAALDHRVDVIRTTMEPPERTGGSFFWNP